MLTMAAWSADCACCHLPSGEHLYSVVAVWECIKDVVVGMAGGWGQGDGEVRPGLGTSEYDVYGGGSISE